MTNALEKMDQEIKTAMLAKDTVRLGVLRLLKSALKYYQIEKKLDVVAETDLISVVQKQLKQRQDSIESFQQANRQDLAEKELAEAAILKTFLPQALSEDELENLVTSVIAELGATTKTQLGLVMKAAIAKAAGRADGKAINAIAAKKLQ